MEDVEVLQREVEDLNVRADGLPAEGILALALSLPGSRAVFTTSFGAEDQLLTHLIAGNDYPVDIITLDTGRLFNETLETFEQTRGKYGDIVRVLFPSPEDVESFVNANGPNAFYRSVDLRKECCNIRKLKPLQRGLKGYGTWITGVRADQSENRSDARFFEWDDRFRLIKANPLLRWTYDEVMAFVRSHQVPYNPLHDVGYVSIGCAPCTRAISEGESFRAGRWWWESSHKECGLHRSKDH